MLRDLWYIPSITGWENSKLLLESSRFSDNIFGTRGGGGKVKVKMINEERNVIYLLSKPIMTPFMNNLFM